MDKQFLAEGFRDVDVSGDPGSCSRCLDLISSVPFFRECKEESYRIIAREEPGLVLDAGCGAGNDLAPLSRILPARSMLVGLDASRNLLAAAWSRLPPGRARVSLVRGDLNRIPFRDGSFGACRIDRVLQHIPEPGRVVRELARVLSPGGTLVAFDNDWATFGIGLDDPDVSRRLAAFWLDSFASGRAGAGLAGHFREAGLAVVTAGPRTLELTDYPVAEGVFDIPCLLDRSVAAGVLDESERDDVRRELQARDEDGKFSVEYTAWLVSGRKRL